MVDLLHHIRLLQHHPYTLITHQQWCLLLFLFSIWTATLRKAIDHSVHVCILSTVWLQWMIDRWWGNSLLRKVWCRLLCLRNLYLLDSKHFMRPSTSLWLLWLILVYGKYLSVHRWVHKGFNMLPTSTWHCPCYPVVLTSSFYLLALLKLSYHKLN